MIAELIENDFISECLFNQKQMQAVWTPYMCIEKCPPGGELTYVGQPAKPLSKPNITTLIPNKDANAGEIKEVKLTKTSIGNIIKVAGAPAATVAAASVDPDADDDDIGFQITIAPQKAEIRKTEGSSSGLPRNYEEAYKQLNKFSTGKSSRMNRYYKIDELREIALNLKLSKIGSKNILVNRIVDAIESIYGQTGSKR